MTHLKLTCGTALSSEEAATSSVPGIGCTRTFPMCVPGKYAQRGLSYLSLTHQERLFWRNKRICIACPSFLIIMMRCMCGLFYAREVSSQDRLGPDHCSTSRCMYLDQRSFGATKQLEVVIRIMGPHLRPCSGRRKVHHPPCRP